MRADSFFTNLTKRQSMLLLTAVTFGGAEGVAALAHLGEDELEILGERAARLMEVPREKRIPFLVQEMKRLVMGRKGGDLRGADPEQVVQALRGERPALAEVILRALPAQLAEGVRNELPPARVKLAHAVKPEILQVIRWHFERRLQQLTPQQASFLFPDVLQLTAKDLLTLSDHLGADELGPALAGVEAPRREELLRTLTAEQRTLAAKASSASEARKLPVQEAAAALDDLAGDDPRHLVRRGGLRRLVRACLAESPEFASRLAERHRDELGRLLVAAIRSERAVGRSRHAERLKVEVVARMEALAQRGLMERPVRLTSPRQAMQARMGTEALGGPRVSAEKVPVPPPAPRRTHERPPREEMQAIAAPPAARPAHRSEIKRDPAGSGLNRDPRPGRARGPSDPAVVAKADPSGSAIHRMPLQRPGATSIARPRVVRGDAAEKARPARPRPAHDDDER
jgi:hypothetical protein